MKAPLLLLLVFVLSGTHARSMGYPVDLFAQHPCLQQTATLVVRQNHPATRQHCTNQMAYQLARKAHPAPQGIGPLRQGRSFLDWLGLGHETQPGYCW